MDQKVKVKNVIDYRTMKYFYMYNLKSKNFIIIYGIFAAICLILSGVSIAIPLMKGGDIQWFLPIVLAVFSLYLIYTIITVEKKIENNISNHFATRRPSEHILELNEEGITISYTSENVAPITFEWVMITKIHEIPQFYYLFSGKQLILIDKSEEAIIEGDKESLEAIIKAQIAVKPYKKFNKDFVKRPITFVHPEFPEDLAASTEADIKEINDVETSENIEEVAEDLSDKND